LIEYAELVDREGYDHRAGIVVLVILHSGQTGVERGAYHGAMSAGVGISGFMPRDGRDELGAIPAEIADLLTPCSDRGPRQAVRANMAIASGVLLVVPEARVAAKFTAMSFVLHSARSERVGCYTCDGTSNLDDVVMWVRGLPETSDSKRLLVTGPRGTRWTNGEAIARRVITAIGLVGDS